MNTTPLADLASVIRSKNAGPFVTTCDVVFDDAATYEHVVQSGVLTSDLIAGLYRIPESWVRGIYHYPVANAIKISLLKETNTGDVFCSDILGASQHVPLLSIDIPNSVASD